MENRYRLKVVDETHATLQRGYWSNVYDGIVHPLPESKWVWKDIECVDRNGDPCDPFVINTTIFLVSDLKKTNDQ